MSDPTLVKLPDTPLAFWYGRQRGIDLDGLGQRGLADQRAGQEAECGNNFVLNHELNLQ